MKHSLKNVKRCGSMAVGFLLCASLAACGGSGSPSGSASGSGSSGGTGSSEQAAPGGAVALDEEHFPDENFRSLVAEDFDKDSDGTLSEEEIEAATEFSTFEMASEGQSSCNQFMTNSSNDTIKSLYTTDEDITYLCKVSTQDERSQEAITSVKGIEYLTNLEHVALGELGEVSEEKHVTMVDLTGNTHLKSLLVHGYVDDVNLSGCAELRALDVTGTPIKELDVTKNTKLVHLDFADNYNEDGSKLDLTQNSDLVYLDLQDGSLTSIDLTKNTKLYYLDLSFNDGLTQAPDLSSNTSLEYLQLSNDGLNSVDLSSNKELKYVDLSGNELESIDLSANSKLDQVEVRGNKLTSLDLSSAEGHVKVWVDDGVNVTGEDVSVNYN